MTEPAAEREVLHAFLDYLNRRELAICNFSRNIVAYWPVGEPKAIVEGFLSQ